MLVKLNHYTTSTDGQDPYKKSGNIQKFEAPGVPKASIFSLRCGHHQPQPNAAQEQCDRCGSGSLAAR